MKKTFRIYAIIFFLVMLILGLLQLTKKEIVNWGKNYKTEEKSPFGLYIFDKEIQQLLGGSLEKIENSPFDYFKNNTPKKPINILVVEKSLDKASWKKILNQVNNGATLMVLSSDFDTFVEDTLRFSSSNTMYLDHRKLLFTDKKLVSDSIYLDKYPTNSTFSTIPANAEIVGKCADEDGKYRANFIKIPQGKGTVYLHSEPLPLTNYYLLNSKSIGYVQGIFSYLPNQDTIWFVHDSKEKNISQSPLRFILSHPSLRYAWWLLLLGLLIFVFFNAKRRQRIVPIIEPPKNKSVEFVKSIGNLYLQEGDFHDMMAKKSQYFLNKIRIDLLIETQVLDDVFAHKLHLKTGAPTSKIQETIRLIKKAQDPYANVIQDDLINMAKLMDEILTP